MTASKGDHGPRIDHIIIAAKDIDKAADDILKKYGLAGYAGGKHQGGWGTQNYIIPLGEAYIEIAAVFDEEAAKGTDWGKFIKAAEERVTDSHPWVLATFCVEVPEGAEGVARRLKHSHDRMLRTRPDGSKLTWSVAAMERFEEPGRTPKPFFITWDEPSKRPDKTHADHKTKPYGIEFVEVSGDEKAMKEWIGADVDVRWSQGVPGLHAIGIKTENGTVVLK